MKCSAVKYFCNIQLEKVSAELVQYKVGAIRCHTEQQCSAGTASKTGTVEGRKAGKPYRHSHRLLSTCGGHQTDTGRDTRGPRDTRRIAGTLGGHRDTRRITGTL